MVSDGDFGVWRRSPDLFVVLCMFCLCELLHMALNGVHEKWTLRARTEKDIIEVFVSQA